MGGYTLNVKERILERITQRQTDREDGVHVTDMCFPCLRRGWFKRFLGEYFDARTALTLWHGRAIHGLSLGDKQEITFRWNGIVGTIDDYDTKEGVLIDKKSIDSMLKIRKYLPKPEHVFQLGCYAVLMTNNVKILPKEFHIAYFEKAQPHKLVEFDVTSKVLGLKDVEAQMVAAKNIIMQEADNPPPRVCNEWTCEYCSYVPKCFSEFKNIYELLPEKFGVVFA